MKVTMIEIEAGEGYNEGPELRLLLQSNEITTLPRAIKTFSATQAKIFSQYDRTPTDFRPILGHHDGYRFNSEWTFPMEAN